MLLPALSKAKAKGQTTACLNNLRQLQLAWRVYVEDHSDDLPPIIVDVRNGVYFSLPGSWVLGNAQMDVALSNIEQGVLFPYAHAPGVYLCPSDQSIVVGDPQKTRRRRSYSLSLSLNGLGPAIHDDTNYPYVRKFLQIRTPAPSLVFGFLDVHESAIDSGDFSWRVGDYTHWEHQPAARHNRGDDLSFVDGHAEHHRWKWPKQFLQFGQPTANPLDQEDLDYLREHRPRR